MNPYAAMMRADEHARAIDQALTRCTPRQRFVWRLASGIREDGTHAEPMPLADIAAALGVSKPVARTHFVAAKVQVLEALVLSLLVGVRNGTDEDFEALMQGDHDPTPLRTADGLALTHVADRSLRGFQHHEPPHVAHKGGGEALARFQRRVQGGPT